MRHGRHASIEALEHRAERVNLSAREFTSPTPLVAAAFFVLTLELLTAPPSFDNTTMKLSDIDLDLDAVDFVRTAFLVATGGVSMHSHPRPCLSPG